MFAPSQHDQHAIAAGVAATGALALSNRATTTAVAGGIAVGFLTNLYMRRYGHTFFGQMYDKEERKMNFQTEHGRGRSHLSIEERRTSALIK